LLAKEAFGERMENQQPISFHELFYPILQGYDSVAIEADVELGGTDQRFNILQGRELQPHYNLDQQVAFLPPLIEGTDGAKKMSKTYANFIGLSEPPSDMFGKCMRIPDELIVKYFELTTTLSGAEVDEIKDFLQSGGNPKEAKARLAKQIVLQYHGEDAARDALTEWDTIHSKRQIPDDMPEYKLTEEKQLFRLLVDTELASGSGQAKRLIADGGVRIDGDQVKDPNQSISPGQGDSIVLQVGRRRFIRINL
ncbi:MAG TPA: tyrosine--tRNA ligase, partial [Candidatus Melainabacteria bacterium]|nr:tyrosine--tRNA ligase [Candidatus Melainabacteria bacterium]